MKPPDDEKKAPAGTNLGEGDKDHQRSPDSKRSRLRQYFSAHIHAAGPRPVLEAMIAIHEGAHLDDVLEDFARIPAEAYHAMGASSFPKPFSGTSS